MFSARPRLPDDVYEVIIDHCDPERWDPYDRNPSPTKTLLSCALTCQKWLRRSRFNLYSAIYFRRFEQVNQYLSTITSKPFLADFALMLVISPRRAAPLRDGRPTGEYIPFARKELVRRLRNVSTLVLDNRTHGLESLPPTYLQWAARYPITKLHIYGGFTHAATFCRFLWAFRNLQYLQIQGESPDWRGLSDHVEHRIITASKLQNRCTSLRCLELGPDFTHVVTGGALVLQYALPRTVTEVTLHRRGIELFEHPGKCRARASRF
ncbi:hypothetical protein OH77DRAFT_1064180 [Trametes cingulata]|nr:hypothetical protein OH77DRAFT_1064180 [Trametes cingulata]